MGTPEPAARKRKTQERAELTRSKLIDVALQEFSERGFDAVTVREIEVKAGVQRNLVSYHFGSKDELWKAAAAQVIGHLRTFTADRQELVRDLPARERVAYTIRSYVRFAAQHPELQRLMSQEGKQQSWRMHWLVDTFIRPGMDGLRALLGEELDLGDAEFMHWYYLFVSGGASAFAMAPEARLLFDVDVTDEAFVTRHGDMMVRLLLGSRENDAGESP